MEAKLAHSILADQLILSQPDGRLAPLNFGVSAVPVVLLRERPLMTSDFRVGRGVQNDPKNRTF